jgi:hypothetical protein
MCQDIVEVGTSVCYWWRWGIGLVPKQEGDNDVWMREEASKQPISLVRRFFLFWNFIEF